MRKVKRLEMVRRRFMFTLFFYFVPTRKDRKEKRSTARPTQAGPSPVGKKPALWRLDRFSKAAVLAAGEAPARGERGKRGARSGPAPGGRQKEVKRNTARPTDRVREDDAMSLVSTSSSEGEVLRKGASAFGRFGAGKPYRGFGRVWPFRRKNGKSVSSDESEQELPPPATKQDSFRNTSLRANTGALRANTGGQHRYEEDRWGKHDPSSEEEESSEEDKSKRTPFFRPGAQSKKAFGRKKGEKPKLLDDAASDWPGAAAPYSEQAAGRKDKLEKPPTWTSSKDESAKLIAGFMGKATLSAASPAERRRAFVLPPAEAIEGGIRKRGVSPREERECPGHEDDEKEQVSSKRRRLSSLLGAQL